MYALVDCNNFYVSCERVFQPHLNGKPVEKSCVPNLSDRMMVPGFGLNYCENNKPVHLNFNERSECYTRPGCNEEDKIQTCIDPYMQN